MSYDIRFDTREGYRLESEHLNYTYNCSPMFQLAIPKRGLMELHAIRAGDAADKLIIAVEKFERAPDKFKTLNPKNGWGDYESALQFLKSFLCECQRMPEAVVSVS